MIVLGIDCTTKHTNIGLVDGEKVLGEISVELGRQQSQKLPLLVEKLLEDSLIKLKDINYIAAANGPGYYTGIRTGIAYSAALAEALEIKVIPISTMLSFVYDLRTTYEYIAPVLKARQFSLYSALYKFKNEGFETVIEPNYCKSETLSSKLKEYRKAVIVGSDSILYPDIQKLPNLHINRLSGKGSSTSILGNLRTKLAIEPSELRGEYLRAPDIGATVG